MKVHLLSSFQCRVWAGKKSWQALLLVQQPVAVGFAHMGSCWWVPGQWPLLQRVLTLIEGHRLAAVRTALTGWPAVPDQVPAAELHCWGLHLVTQP